MKLLLRINPGPPFAETSGVAKPTNVLRSGKAFGPSDPMSTLRDMAPGGDAWVQSFAAELRPEVSRRLRELGFGQGDLVRCLRAAPFGGPRVYCVSGAAFALDAEL